MDINKFVSLVERMRESQTIYFKTKNYRVFQRALILEGLVDEEIKTFNNEQKKNVIQPSLFDNEP